MRQINTVIIHCSDTPADMDVSAEEIRRWHVEERGFDDIGYQWVIRRDGSIEKGRDEKTVGAHAYGHNARSIGICMVGGRPTCNFTAAQWESLDKLVSDIDLRYPGVRVIGHNDVSGKTCPTFDAKAWWG